MNLERFITTLVVVLIILIIYYASTWQRKKQQKDLKKLQNELKKGDRIITYSGLSGIVEEVKEDRIIVKLHPEKTKVSIEKWAVAGIDDRDID